jgi:ribonucleotide reductase class II
MDPEMDKHELNHRINRYGTNPCAEIEGKDFLCNLSEVFLNNLDPANLDQQKEAFEAAALAVAALLHQNFTDEKMQYSRELDPIVGVGITGLFDFFVNAIGVDYAQWMVENRPMDDETRGPVYAELEQRYLNLWYRWVEDTITEYCNKHGLKKPNRFTCVKPSGTLSLLTGASPGWHPPKASHMIRRITFSKEDPIAMAYNAMGYRITPAHSDTDENGNLLDDPWDPRVNEWLVEIPITTTWGHLEGADEVKLENIPATAQMGLWKQVQIHWTGHNTSATIEFRENEIDSLSQWIYDSIQNNDGAYTSVAMLARFDNYQSFPRLPFEPISKEVYEKHLTEIEQNQVFDNFDEALAYFDQYYLNQDQVQGPSGCDSDKCLIS